MYICPVCGYEKLEDPPMNFTICPCCGTEFDYDDYRTSFALLRTRWITRGCRWFSNAEPAPADWDANRQLLNLAFARKPEVISDPRRRTTDVVNRSPELRRSAAV